MPQRSKFSHDQVFKNIFLENPVDTIVFAIPASAEIFKEQPEIIPIREESTTHDFDKSFFRLDVPFLVKFADKGFIFLIEHQHDRFKFSIHKLNNYVLKLEEMFECDVIPIVFFPTASLENHNIQMDIKSQFLGKTYHYFTYEAVCLKDYNSEDYLESQKLFDRLMLPFMKNADSNKVKVLYSILRGLFQFIEDKDALKRVKYFRFIDYYLQLEKQDVEKLNTFLSEKEREEVQMVTETWYKEGKEEGKIEGKIEGKLDVLDLLLGQKFPVIPEDLKKKLHGIKEPETITDVISRLKDFNSIEDLIKYVNEQLN